MYFSAMDKSIRQPDTRSSLALAPSSTPVDSSQPSYFADSGTCGESLDVRNVTQNFEVHSLIVSMSHNSVNSADFRLAPKPTV